MIYVIDANNLAGKLDLLGQDNFDKTLIELIKEYFGDKNKIFLIFDSLEQMGDKYEDENVTVVYTPRDDFYINGADDKIIEVLDVFLDKKFETKLSDVNFRKTDGAILVTDDIELLNRAKDRFSKETSFKDGKHMRLQIHSATEFAQKIIGEIIDDTISDEEDEKLSESEEEDVNSELMDLWRK